MHPKFISGWAILKMGNTRCYLSNMVHIKPVWRQIQQMVWPSCTSEMILVL